MLFFRVGNSGNGILDITNGGMISSILSYIAYDTGSTGTVMIDGTNSTWDNDNDLYVGYNGNGTINITAGGTLVSDNSAYIGTEVGSTGTISVDGTYSTWTHDYNLYVGKSGSGTLNIANGGAVTSNFNTDLGSDSGSNGTVNVDGTGSTWKNTGGISIGEYGSGTLYVINGGTVSSQFADIGSQAGSSGSVTVDGTGSTWKTGNPFRVGNGGSGTLNITGGGSVSSVSFASNVYLGAKSGSTGVVTVNGTDSNWSVTTDEFHIGSSGNGTLNITDGGSVYCSYTTYLGSNSGSTGIVTVDGIGSTWNSWDLNIGSAGIGTVNITNGGLAYASGTTTIGDQGTIYFNGGTLDTVHLDADETKLTGTGTLILHDIDVITDDTLVIESPDDLIGYHHTINNNPDQNITVNYRIDQYGALGVGKTGTGSLSIKNGMIVSSAGGYIGRESTAIGTMTVDGTDTLWRTSYQSISSLYIGEYGRGALNIINGGKVSSGGYHEASSYIGYMPSSEGTVVVNGTGSTWDNTGDLYVGCEGNGTLNITNGATVNSTAAYLGYDSGAIGTVTVDGTGSTWITYDDLQVGCSGNGILNITNGGLVSVADTTIIGDQGTINFDGGTLDTVHLDADETKLAGTGTLILHDINIITDDTLVLDSPDDLTVYYRTINSKPNQNITVNYQIDGTKFLGAGNTGTGSLTIKNGIEVSSPGGYIGRDATAVGTVTVTETGSTWDNNGQLYVGYSGTGTLNITGGATVNSNLSVLGYYSNSTGTVTVDGVDSVWDNCGSLTIGRQGNSTLAITNGGLVSVAGTLTIDYDTDGNGFINMATGGMLALFGDADESLGDFLDLIEGTDAIRYWDDSIADWANITDATLAIDYTLKYLTEGDLNGYTLLTVKTSLTPGDANGDGRVDGSDVTIVAGNWQVSVLDDQTPTWAMGDFNGDGKVDGSDVTILAGNWQYGVTATSAAVPEPNCITLLLASLASSLAWVSRRRR